MHLAAGNQTLQLLKTALTKTNASPMPSRSAFKPRLKYVRPQKKGKVQYPRGKSNSLSAFLPSKLAKPVGPFFISLFAADTACYCHLAAVGSTWNIWVASGQQCAGGC
jgi:hypothetical protein